MGYTTGQWARRADFYDYILTMDKPPNTNILPCHDRSPAHGRNLLFGAARELEHSHIMLMDDDVVPPKDGMMRLLAHDKDIVTGLVLSQPYPHAPLVFDLVTESGAALNMYLHEPPGLKEVKNCGFGFVLFKTHIFDKLEKPWVRLGELDPEQWCDDIGFFNRVTKAGFKIYCDTSVMVGHINTHIITPEYKDGKWYTIYNTGGPESIRIPQMVVNADYSFTEEEKDGLGQFTRQAKGR